MGQLRDGKFTDAILKYTQSFLHFWQNRNIVRKPLVVPSLVPRSMPFLKMLVYIDDASRVGGATHQDKQGDYQWYSLITLSKLLLTCGIVANTSVVHRLCVTGGCTPPPHPWDSMYGIDGSNSSCLDPHPLCTLEQINFPRSPGVFNQSLG